MPAEMINAAAAGTWTLGDRTINRIGYGSMRITANPDRDLAIRVLRRAVDLGVDHIDTAAFYVSPGGTLGVGEGPARYATELIRDALTPYPEQLLIATKVGPEVDPAGGLRPATTAAQLRGQVEENLRRLGRDHLDLVNLRIWRRDAGDVAEQFGWLERMRAEGLIRHLGVSNAGLHHLDQAQAVAPVACVQNSYGLELRRDEPVLRACGERGIAFVPFFALAGAAREQGPAREQGFAREQGAARGQSAGAARAQGTPAGQHAAVRALAAAHDATPQQVQLAWTLHQGPHVLAIPGTGSAEHLAQNVAAGALRFTPAELATLDATG